MKCHLGLKPSFLNKLNLFIPFRKVFRIVDVFLFVKIQFGKQKESRTTCLFGTGSVGVLTEKEIILSRGQFFFPMCMQCLCASVCVALTLRASSIVRSCMTFLYEQMPTVCISS